MPSMQANFIWLQTALLFNRCASRPAIATHDVMRVLVLVQMLLLMLAVHLNERRAAKRPAAADPQATAP